MAVILLAEDSPTHTALMRSLLEDASHTVHCVANGREAVSAIDELEPAMLLTDLRMPEMGGLELVETITKTHPELPSVVVTARGSETLAVDALAVGAANFVPKNSLSTLLTHVVSRTLELAEIDRTSRGISGQLMCPEFRCQLRSDLASIPIAASFVVQALAAARQMNPTQRVRVGTAIASAVFNAVVYGNLELDDDESTIRQLLSGDTEGLTQLQQRAGAEPYRDRRVQLRLSVGEKDTRILVAHDGPGRLTRMTPAPGTPESFELEQCRGLMLITSFMDDVQFQSDFSEVVMVKDHDPGDAESNGDDPPNPS